MADAASRYPDFHHEVALYSSDEEFLGTVVPFVRDGIEQGEPVLINLREHTRGLILSMVGAVPGVIYLNADATPTLPATAIRAYRELLADLTRQGSRPGRLVGDLLERAGVSRWAGWARYEAAVNRVYAEFPVRTLCVYDTRTTPAEVLADVRRTHPHIVVTGGSCLDNDDFEDPQQFLAERLYVDQDPAEPDTPAVDLVDPLPALARHAIREAAKSCLADPDDVDDAVIAAGEAAANALRHGGPSVRIRAWAQPERLVIAVTDSGDGPSDPYVGLIPALRTGTSLGGRGLWMIHQVCSEVSLHRCPEGFTIRMVIEGMPRTVATSAI